MDLMLCQDFHSCISAQAYDSNALTQKVIVSQVVLLFEEDFWGSTDMFGRLAPSTSERGKFFLFYSYTGISGQPDTIADQEQPCWI